MKKIKILSLMLIILLMTSGCFKRDTLEGIEIITTVYPIEFVTSNLYGEHSIVNSIYPDGTDTTSYKLTEKQKKDFSKKGLFIYNGLSDDKDLARTFLSNNKNMLIIDSSFGIETTYGIEEIWLNPSNLLMMSQNIRNGLKEYIKNSYLNKEIDKAYENLKVQLSEIDAEIKLTAENATRKTIVVNNNSLKYLEKYGFKVISLDDSIEEINEKTISEVKNLIEQEAVKHFILLENTKTSKTWDNIIKDTEIESLTFRRMDNITDEERDSKENYITIMNDNIDLLKSELY